MKADVGRLIESMQTKGNHNDSSMFEPCRQIELTQNLFILKQTYQNSFAILTCNAVQCN